MKWPLALKSLWTAACVAVLIWTVVSCGQQTNWTLRGECSFLASGLMLVLTAPLGFLWMLLLNAAGYGLGILGMEIGAPSLVSDFIVWLGFAVLGYLQWFRLLPWMIARWRSRSAGASGGRPGGNSG